MNRRPGMATWCLAILLIGTAPPAGAQAGPTSLADAVRMAIATDPGLQAEAARLAAADRGVTEAAGALRPQARIDALGTRFQEPMVVAPLHQFNPQQPPVFDHTLLQFQATASIVLLDGGLRRAGVHRAEAGVSASASRLDATRVALVAEVAGVWLDVAAGRELVAAQQARLASLEAERDRVRQLVQVGRAAPLDSLRVQAALEGAGADLVGDLQQLRTAEQSLARLISVASAVIETTPVAPIRVREAMPDSAWLLREATRSSPEIALAESQLGIAEATASAAGSAWWPELRLVGGYTDYWSGDGRLTGEWQAGLRAGLPLYAGGTRRAQSQRAGLEVDAARATREAVRRRIETAVDHGMATWTSATARAAALESAVAQHQEVVRIEQLSLDAGAGTRRDWIEATADLLAAQHALVEARHAQASARIELARLTGQLSADFLETLLETQP